MSPLLSTTVWSANSYVSSPPTTNTLWPVRHHGPLFGPAAYQHLLVTRICDGANEVTMIKGFARLRTGLAECMNE
jgi:hypothetical protein